MAENRTPRDVVSRDKTPARFVYRPSSTLPDPTPEPGWSYRWISTHILGASDPTNVSRKMRDGWEPVKATDHPELMLEGAANGNVEIGGLMLCKMPTERLASIKEYFEDQNKAQIQSVDNNFMRQNDPRMPLFAEKQSTTSRGSGFGSGSK